MSSTSKFAEPVCRRGTVSPSCLECCIPIDQQTYQTITLLALKLRPSQRLCLFLFHSTMGVCISKPAAGSKEAPLDANPIPGNLEGRGEVVSAEPAAKPTPPADEPLTEAPVKVYKDGKVSADFLRASLLFIGDDVSP